MHKFKLNITSEDQFLKGHEILKFQGVENLTFDQFRKAGFSYGWGNATDFFKNISPSTTKFLTQYETEGIMHAYTKRVGKSPLFYELAVGNFDKKFIPTFFDELNPPESSYCVREELTNDGYLNIEQLYLFLEEDLWINYYNNLYFLLDPNKHLKKSDDNPFYLFLRLLSEYEAIAYQKNKIHIVYKGDYGFEKVAFKVKEISIDLKKNYNEGFEEVSDHIVKNLNKKNEAGLYILSGMPGVGKTSWIRYLAGKIKRNIIFISPDMVHYITDPGFIPFLMDNSDSVLIIEDAEPVLQKRTQGSRTNAISNILNLTDGLLSDCLNISIVATFNTNEKTIDEALLRHGRLKKSYRFEKLSREKSTKLLKEFGHDEEAKEPMTLAEIYYYGQDLGNVYKENKIGF